MVGELPAIHATTTAHARDRRVALDLMWIAHAERIYRVIGATPPDGAAAAKPLFRATVESFRPLTASERAGIRETRVRIVAARGRETGRRARTPPQHVDGRGGGGGERSRRDGASPPGQAREGGGRRAVHAWALESCDRDHAVAAVTSSGVARSAAHAPRRRAPETLWRGWGKSRISAGKIGQDVRGRRDRTFSEKRSCYTALRTKWLAAVRRI